MLERFSYLVLIVASLGLSARVHADAQSGEQVFQVCAACHHTRADATGPLLFDVLGRKAGSVPGFRYSGPMKRANLTWTVDTLRAFLRNPQQVVPGNRMPFSGLEDTQQIEDVLVFLQKKK